MAFSLKPRHGNPLCANRRLVSNPKRKICLNNWANIARWRGVTFLCTPSSHIFFFFWEFPPQKTKRNWKLLSRQSKYKHQAKLNEYHCCPTEAPEFMAQGHTTTHTHTHLPPPHTHNYHPPGESRFKCAFRNTFTILSTRNPFNRALNC